MPLPAPHWSHSDHISVFVTPAYKPLQNMSEHSALQDCFRHTDLDVFKTAASYDDLINIQEYAEAVTCYTAKCTN